MNEHRRPGEQRNEFTPRERGHPDGEPVGAAQATARDHIIPFAEIDVPPASPEFRHEIEQHLIEPDDIEKPNRVLGRVPRRRARLRWGT